METFDVVVVGAGLSGLSAARRLEKYGQSVLVVEARDRVGGRTYTVKDSEHGSVDLGGAYVGPTQYRVTKLVRELGLQLYDVRDDKKKVMELKGFVAKHVTEIPPFYNPIKLLDLNHVIRTIDTMAKQVPLEAPWTAKQADKWDCMTVANFLDTIAWTRSAKDCVKLFIRALFCAEPSELSLLHVLWYIHSGGGVSRMANVSNGAQEKKIEGGSQQLSERLASELKNTVKLDSPVSRIEQNEDSVTVIVASGQVYKLSERLASELKNTVKLDSPVSRIEQNEDSVTVIVASGQVYKLSERLASELKNTVKLDSPVSRIEQNEDSVTVIVASGQVYKAKYVVSSVPQPLLNRMAFQPPLPWQRLQLVQRMPMGCIIKTVLFYKQQFWRDLDLCGQAASSEGVCCYCIDDTKPDGSHPAIMGFILAERARELALMTPEDRKQQLCLHYARVFGSKDFMDPVGYTEYNWMADQYSGGCYTSVMPPNALTAFARYLRDPHGLVYFAGTETATTHAGYMDGALESGERAANQILSALGKVSAAEIYVAEPEDPDHPASPVRTSKLDWYLPSVSSLLKFSVAVATAFVASSTYYFVYSWQGELFRRWLVWKYQLDEYSIQHIAGYIPILGGKVAAGKGCK